MHPTARTPHEVPGAFAARFNSWDVDAVAEMYEPGAVLVPEPGAPAQGDGLRQALLAHMSLRVPIDVRPRHVYQTEDVALLIVDWTISGHRPDGDHVAISGTATDIARRAADGTWRYAVDNPMGTA
ncbi:YybH family protein [Nocardiopsis mangrovi]|uniref:YybH family protein n=1 Tax=Nocardiopsis mangrovi TaxID=1179818 RepID=A0ABV9E489_9ACTN